MFKFIRSVLVALACSLLSTVGFSQEAADSQAIERKARIQELRRLNQEERQAKRQEMQKQLESLTDEQRQALRERRRLRESSSVRSRGQRLPRRRPPVSDPPTEDQAEAEEPA